MKLAGGVAILLAMLGVPAAASAEDPFAPVAQVLRHPRCLNCHTARDVPAQGEDRVAHRFRVSRGRDDHGTPGMRCDTCHGERNNDASGVPGAPRWSAAPRSMAWEGLDDAALCRVLVDRRANGGRDIAALVDHMANDRLVAWGWNPGSHRPPVQPDKPTFVASLERWAAAGAPCPPASKPVFVLVHGAWMDRTAWDGVVQRLRKAGAEVAVVNLPAHGDDRTPVDAASLDAYVAAVGRSIGDRRGVTLVGHSFGGIVVTQAAERYADRLAKVVYVAAYLPRDGESALTWASQDGASAVPRYWRQQDDGAASRAAIAKEGVAEVFCADCDGATAARLGDRERAEPLAPLATPVHVSAERFGRIPRAYVFTAQDRAVSTELQRRMVAATPVAATRTLATSHAPMLSSPDELARVLLELSR